MSTILPQGTALKKALSWISENLKSSREAAIDILINDAVFKYFQIPKGIAAESLKAIPEFVDAWS